MKWSLTAIGVVVAVAVWTLREPVVGPSLHLCPQAVMICLPFLNQSPRLSL